MKSIQINGTLRTETGRKAAKKIRKQNLVPCNLYGGSENVIFNVVDRDLVNLIYTGDVYIVDLNISGNERKAILKEIQFHPTSDKVQHIDFLEVVAGKKVTIGVPVKLNGFAVGVKAGGKLHLITRKLKVAALVENLPDTIELDVENLELGKSIKVVDIQMENVEFLDPKNLVVASVKLTRATKGMEETTTDATTASTETAAAAQAEAKEKEKK